MFRSPSRRRHPIHALPFEDSIANALEAEYREQSFGRRFQARRKAFGRAAMLVLGGQSRLHVEEVPHGTRRMLWAYSWTTVGDAIMDLAPRSLLPPQVAVELLIAPHLAPLFATDARFRRVHVDPAACGAGFDLLLLDSLRTSALRMRRKHFADVPFATMREHQAGERFDRAAYADRRLRQLFGVATGPVVGPHIDLADETPRRGTTGRFRIGLALGSRLPSKLYPHWLRAIHMISAGWPASAPKPEFALLGQGDSARRQRDELTAAPLPNDASTLSLVGSGSLRKTAIDLAGCNAFLGVDGGLMHVAIGVGTPGLALFTRVDPVYFLRPESTMRPLASAGGLGGIEPERVAQAFLDGLTSFRGLR